MKRASASTSRDSRDDLLPLFFEMGRVLKSQMAEEGSPVTSYLHLETLRFISEQGSPSMRDVAAYLKIAPPSATALVNIFVQEGILARVYDPEDRRRVLLTLSPKGAKALEDALARRNKVFKKLLAKLSDEECQEFARIITRIIHPA